MNTLVLGKIIEVLDTDEYPKTKFIIKVSISGETEDALAFPLDTLDQPEVGEEVLLFRLETIFGYSYLWKKLKLNDDTRMKVLGSVIDITKDGITIKSASEENSDNPESLVTISNDGKVTVQTCDNITIKTDKSVDIDTKELRVKSSQSTEFESMSTEFIGSGGTVKIQGNVLTPDPTGSFCFIPTCPFTGAAHVGNTITIL